MSKNFSLKAICAVTGMSTKTIAFRAKNLGIVTHRKGYTAEQAHSLIYYQRKRNTVRTETLEEETARLIDTLKRMNTRHSKKTLVEAQ